jgi:hypothetical protein
MTPETSRTNIGAFKHIKERIRKQGAPNEMLDKLIQIHHLTKLYIAEDITLAKDAVNIAIQSTSRRSAHGVGANRE